MEFEDAFELGVFDYNQPVGAHYDKGGGEEEIWKQNAEEPVEEKVWQTLSTECCQEFYRVYLSGVFERINPLRYKAEFDGCNLHLFEEGGGINILVDKTWTRSSIVYKLRKLKLKLLHTTVLERRYNVGGEVELYGVQHEYVPIALESPTELPFHLSIFAERVGVMTSV